LLGATEAENIFDKVTHIIVYHRDGQEIPQKNIIRSLGGQAEQDMVTFSQFLNPGGATINVVYHGWLVDCLQNGRILPIADY
ncbi:hypothetical protein KC19_VG312100, partial [Ceratodon purpureus]